MKIRVHLFCILLFGMSSQLHAAVKVGNLSCEDQINPLGVDAVKPRLSWNIESDSRAWHQSAYQIIVASNPEQLAAGHGDLWDSGKISSADNLHVLYGGPPLSSGIACCWKVRVWSAADPTVASDWSAPGTWSMGLLKPADWQAQWISASKWFTPPENRPPGFVPHPGGWADIDLGASLKIDSIRFYCASVPSFPLRFKVEAAEEMQFFHPRMLLDHSDGDFRAVAGFNNFKVSGAGRYIRFVVIAPGPAGNAVVRQMEIISNGKNVALYRPNREMGTEWNSGHAVCMVDGMPSQEEGATCPDDACSIVASPLLRKSFAVTRKVKRAMLYHACMGMADVTINGQKIDDELDGPTFTDYTKRVVYLTHDVTSLLVSDENVIGITVGNGFFSTPTRGFGERHAGDGPPRVMAQLQIEYTDGSSQIVATDQSWKWTHSQIVYNDVWGGYIEDRRLEKANWDKPGYVDSDWKSVGILPSMGGVLRCRLGPAIKCVGELKPSRVEGNQAFFSVYTCGWPRIKVNGHAGQTISISGTEDPRMIFVLAADGPAVLEPRFIYLSGPLHIQVDGLTEPLSADDVRVELVHADLKPTVTFNSSNAFFNTLHDAVMLTQMNYVGDRPMDPMRERQGWTQDVQGMFDTAAYLTDSAALYERWWDDFADAQDPNGYVPSVVPLVGREELGWNSPWWSGVTVYLPWEQYLYYGDRQLLERQYGTMKRYVDFLGNLAADGSDRKWDDYPYFSKPPHGESGSLGILSWMGAGDWMNPYGSRLAVPAPMMDMPAWYRYATIISKAAAVLGNHADAQKYAAVAKNVQTRYNEHYLHADTGLYGDQADSQTAMVLPLALDVVPEQQRKLTYQRLIDAIHARQDHIGCGFVGLPFLLQILTDNRETELANRMVNQHSFPSWHTLMHDGVLFEDWHGGNAQMPSCGGCVGMWLYQTVLGIRPDPDGPGFKKFILAPQPDFSTGLVWADGTYQSVSGPIASKWKCEGNQFTYDLSIPGNTSATVYIPAKSPDSVKESGNAISGVTGVKFLRQEPGLAIYAVESGTWSFTATLPDDWAQSKLSTAAYVPPGKVLSPPESPLVILGKTSSDSLAAFEPEILKESLVGIGKDTCDSVEDTCAQNDGGSTPDAIRNGTTLNGGGTDSTENDGKTFRGYGEGHHLTFNLNLHTHPSGYDLTELRSFAGHPVGRASQHYDVSIATVAEPGRFIKLASVALECPGGGASEIGISQKKGGVLASGAGVKASAVAAIRFDFHDEPAMGFSVYREFQVIGKPHAP